MKVQYRLILVVLGLFAVSLFSYAQDAGNQGGRRIPSPPMNIVTTEIPGMMQPGFRGESGDKGIEQWLEDVQIPGKENSQLYQSTTQGLGAGAEGTKFSGPPNITWNIKKQTEDGTDILISSTNTNKAAHINHLPDPGIYKVENEGSRGVDEGGGLGSTPPGDGGTTTGGTGSTPPGEGGTTTGGTGAIPNPGNDGAAGPNLSGSGSLTPGGGRQVITSVNILTIKAHDITSPNLYALFQEGAGNINLAANESALKQEFDRQLAAMGGRMSMDTELEGDLKEASLLAVFESPKDALPEKKSAAVIKKGVLFDEGGRKLKDESKSVNMVIEDPARQTRKASVTSAAVPGVFVRRNVPFLVVVKQTDNHSIEADAATYQILDTKAGREVEKTDGAYMFRVANYPRDQYEAEADYEFIMNGKDKVGNSTQVRIPLFVVNTQSNFEAGKAE